MWAWNTSACAGWPTGSLADLGPFNIRPARPLLVIRTTHDPATPLSGARALASLSPGARLLTVDAFGHVGLGRSGGVQRIAARFLIDGVLPAEGASCSADKQPFG